MHKIGKKTIELRDNNISQFPHCDARILHAPGECEYCDKHPDWQRLRWVWGICFTGWTPDGKELPCPADHARGDNHQKWNGNVAKPSAPIKKKRTIHISVNGGLPLMHAVADDEAVHQTMKEALQIFDISIDDMRLNWQMLDENGEPVPQGFMWGSLNYINGTYFRIVSAQQTIMSVRVVVSGNDATYDTFINTLVTKFLKRVLRKNGHDDAASETWVLCNAHGQMFKFGPYSIIKDLNLKSSEMPLFYTPPAGVGG